MDNLIIEIILEAAKIIAENSHDLQVLGEQKRIFNEEVNILMEYAREKPAPGAGGTP